MGSELPLLGVKIIEDPNMVDAVEDWSAVRSPARARRRLRRGFPQRVRIVSRPKSEAYQFGDSFVMHPKLAKELRRRLAEKGAEH